MKIERPREILSRFGKDHVFGDDPETLAAVCMWIGSGKMSIMTLPDRSYPPSSWRAEYVTALIEDVSLDPVGDEVQLTGRIKFLDSLLARDMQRLWIEKAIRPAVAGFGNNNKQLTKMSYLFWTPRMDLT